MWPKGGQAPAALADATPSHAAQYDGGWRGGCDIQDKADKAGDDAEHKQQDDGGKGGNGAADDSDKGGDGGKGTQRQSGEGSRVTEDENRDSGSVEWAVYKVRAADCRNTPQSQSKHSTPQHSTLGV